MLLISFVAIESKQRYSCQTDKLFLVIFLKISSCFLPVSLAGVGIPGGGYILHYLVYLSDGDVPFFRVSFSPISFQEQGINGRQIFWTRLSKHVK